MSDTRHESDPVILELAKDIETLRQESAAKRAAVSGVSFNRDAQYHQERKRLLREAAEEEEAAAILEERLRLLLRSE